jgi:hypothetical protein
MAEHHTIEVFLSAPQYLKYRKGEPFQLSNAQLQSSVGKHKVDIHLQKRDYRKLLNAIKNGKGYRFSEKNVKGGSLWGSFKKGLSTVGNFVKNNVSKDDVKNVINKGVDLVAPDSVKDLAKSAVSKTVDYAYDDRNQGKSLKENVFGLANTLQPEIKDVGLQVGKKVVDKVTSKLNEMSPDEVSGEGLKKRFKKGSQEAKDHMAKIRAMRGSGMKKGCGVKRRRGKGFFDDMASGLIHVGIPTLGRIAGTVLGGPAGAMVGETLGEAGADAIGRATGRGLKNKTHTLYGQHVDGIPSPVVSEMSKVRVKNHGYHSRQRGKSGLHIHGGSFLAL